MAAAGRIAAGRSQAARISGRRPRAEHRPRAGRQVELGELVSAAAGLALLVCSVALAWFGTVQPPGQVTGVGLQSSADAWTVLSAGRWLIAAAALAPIGALVLHVQQSGHGTKTETGLVSLVLGGLCTLELAWRVLIAPPDTARVVDAKLGAYLGLLCAVAIAAGGWRTYTEERRLRGARP